MNVNKLNYKEVFIPLFIIYKRLFAFIDFVLQIALLYLI
jgi:hypothetical protein